MLRDASTGGWGCSKHPSLSRSHAPQRTEGGRRGVGVATTSGVGRTKPPNHLFLYLNALPKGYITLNVFSLLLGGWIVPGSVLVHLPIHLNAVVTG